MVAIKTACREIGTFHGGDLQGLTSKLDYLQQMGVNALWISSPFEQIHGWVGGGTKGDFPHYAYHGYYTQDWSKLDANMGTEADLRRLVDEAHKRGNTYSVRRGDEPCRLRHPGRHAGVPVRLPVSARR